MSELQVHTAFAAGRSIVRLSGEADLPGVPTIEAALRPLLERGTAVIVDIAGVEFCSYSFLSALERLRTATAPFGGSLYVAGATRWLRGVLRKIGMTSLLVGDQERLNVCPAGPAGHQEGSAAVGE